MTFLFEGIEREYLLNLSSNYPTAICTRKASVFTGAFCFSYEHIVLPISIR